MSADAVRVPAEVFHPGVTLEEERIARGLTKGELAMVLGISSQYASDLTRCRRGISVDIALRLERAWGTSAQFWLNMQSSWELGLERECRRQWNVAHPDQLVYVEPTIEPASAPPNPVPASDSGSTSITTLASRETTEA